MKKETNNLGNMLNPKHIIFNAVADKLKGTGIIKLTLVFNVIIDKYNVMFSTGDNKSVKLEIQQDEITMLKRVLINKIHRKAREDSKDEVKTIIIVINLEEETFSVFTEDIKGVVTKFEKL